MDVSESKPDCYQNPVLSHFIPLKNINTNKNKSNGNIKNGHSGSKNNNNNNHQNWHPNMENHCSQSSKHD